MSNARDNDSYLWLCTYLIGLIEANLSIDPTQPIGAADVYYGDQTQIPRTPSVVVEPGGKRRDLIGAPRRTETTATAYIIVYHNQITNTQNMRKLDDQLAEALEGLVHQDPFMGGQVVDSMVTRIESGYLERRNSVFRSSRLTVEARSVQRLPSTF